MQVPVYPLMMVLDTQSVEQLMGYQTQGPRTSTLVGNTSILSYFESLGYRQAPLMTSRPPGKGPMLAKAPINSQLKKIIYIAITELSLI